MFAHVMLLLAALLAQPAEFEEAELYVSLEASGGRYVSLYLPEAPEESEALVNGLVDAFGLSPIREDHTPPWENAYGYVDSYAYEDGSWEAYGCLYREPHPEAGLTRALTFDLDHLRAPLQAAGIPYVTWELAPEFDLPIDVHGLTADMALPDYDGDKWVLVTGVPLPTATLSYGYTPWGLIRLLLTGLGLLVLPALAMYWVRMRAARAPAHELGWACFYVQRAYLVAAVASWVTWGGLTITGDPTLPLAFLAPGLEGIRERLGLVLVGILGMTAMLGAHGVLQTLFLHIPGSRWTRGDLFKQAFWLNGALGVVVLLLPWAADALKAGHILAGLVRIVLLVLGAFLCWFMCLRAMGYRVQALEEGSLFTRARELAARANLKNVFVGVLYIEKAPVSNAVATTNNRVMLTDYLVKHLSMREVDVLLAHELGHLVHRHPARIMRGMLFGIIGALLLGFVFCVVLILGLSLAPPLYARIPISPGTLLTFCFLPAGALGLWWHYRRLHRFEFEADAAAVALTEDPEAFIAAIARIMRQNRMPLRWGKATGRWVTHPSTDERIARVAAMAGLDDETVAELVRTGLPERGPSYRLPRGADLQRALGTEQRNGLMVRTLLMNVGVPVGGCAAAALAGHAVADGPAGLSAGGVLGAVVTVLALLYSNDRVGMALLRKARARVRERAGQQGTAPPETAHYVTFSPTAACRFYNGMIVWDVGFVWWAEGLLHFAGDGVRFDIAAHRITTVDVRRLCVGWGAADYACVRWTDDDGGDRSYCFGPAAVGSRVASNRAATVLREALEVGWHAERGVAATEAGLPPVDWADQGVPIEEVVKPFQQLMVAMVCGALTLLTCAGVQRLVETDPAPGVSFTAAAAAFGAMVVVYLPQILGRAPRVVKGGEST